MKINFLLILTLLSACTLAPDYKRPEVILPFKEASNPEKEKITEISWNRFFISPDLQHVVKMALENNNDLKIAALNLEATQAARKAALGNLMPTINVNASETRQNASGPLSPYTLKKQFRANLGVTSYELDFFGRLNSLRMSAYETFLATAQAHEVMEISLIAETINAYIQFLADKEIAQLAEENLAAQSKKYDLTKLRYEHGLDSKTTLITAQTSLEEARSDHENYKKTAKQSYNALMMLTGNFDEKSLPQNVKIDDILINENLLDFVPSKALLSRPDIKQAEHVLKSSNADIGAARAAFFPTISLTGTYGYGSRELSDLFSSKLWTFSPQITLPIFSGGKNMANLKIAEIQKRIEIINYQKAIQTAFREALDELSQREAVASQLKSFEEILRAKQEAFIIADKKYNYGLINNNDNLDAKITWLAARQERLGAKKNYLVNLVSLYKVLGGGSESKEEIK